MSLKISYCTFKIVISDRKIQFFNLCGSSTVFFAIWLFQYNTKEFLMKFSDKQKKLTPFQKV